jgi:hypothetical protein
MMIIDEITQSHARMGGWIEAVKSDIRRPHSPIALSPPDDQTLERYVPVAQRDPLGLAPGQRAAESLSDDDLRAALARFMDQVRENWTFWDMLPDDTMVYCPVCHASHSVRMYR